MERRKESELVSAKLPTEYLKMIRDVFNQNFKAMLTVEKGKRETFVAFGEIYPDELIICLGLKNPFHDRMISCYASVDFPPASARTETSGNPTSNTQAIEIGVGQCVDAIASFFATFFDEKRPVDYEDSESNVWTIIELDKATKAYIRISRNNPELEEQADEMLKQAEAAEESKKASKKSKKNLH